MLAALRASALAPVALAPVAMLHVPEAEPVDAFAHLRDSFDAGPSDPTERTVPWALYKPAAGSAVVSGGAMVITPTQGGSGPTGSLIFTLNNTNQFDGFFAYVAVGPDAPTPTPVGFDARADITASNGDGTGLPAVTENEWRFCPLGLWVPEATYFNEIHVGPGADPNYTGIEVKDTSVDAEGGQSIYPVAERVVSHPLRVQVRIVRRASAPQLIDVYERAYTGLPLSDDTGWVRLYTIDRSATPGEEDDFPERPASVPLPDTVWIFLAAYSNATAADVRSTVHEFWIGETAS